MFQLLMCLIISCDNTKTLDVESYLKYIVNENNGLVKQSKTNNLTMILEYKPIDYLALLEIDKFSLSMNQNTFDSLKGNYNNQLFFVLKLQADGENDFLKANSNNQEDFFKRIEYYNTSFINDVILIQGQDTISCVSANLERNFGISPQTNIGLIFENKTIRNEDFCIQIYDKVFGSSKTNFCFEKNSLTNIPNIIF